MKLDIYPAEFEAMSQTRKKKYIAKLVIQESRSLPVDADKKPLAFVMAGLPGAGKTEFLDTLADIVSKDLQLTPFIRIDLDQIIEVYPDYSPKDYYMFRSQANVVLSYCVDEAIHGRYNIMLDGTFSGESGATVNTVGRLLDNGYVVSMVYMYDKPERAWTYSCRRRDDTGRPIEKEGFIKAAINLMRNLNDAVVRFSERSDFTISAVVQKEIRDREYDIITSKSEVDKILAIPYNIDTDSLKG